MDFHNIKGAVENIQMPDEMSRRITNNCRNIAAQIKENDEMKVNKRILFGAVVLIFALIGIIASFSFLFNKMADVIGSSKTKEEMAWFITPVVMQDPPPFESPDKATNTTIITAGVWRFIMTQDTSKYPADEFNFIRPF